MADISFANIGPTRVTSEQTSRARNVVLTHAATPAARRELLEMLGVLDDSLAHYDHTGRGPEDGGAAASLDSPATPPTPAASSRPDPHPATPTTPRASGGRGHRTLPTRPDTDWRHHAICRDEPDKELFFPVGNSGPALLQAAEAKTVCQRCPVVHDCLAWALESGQDEGVWGGMTADERRAIKRRNARLRAGIRG
jgi:WhiB family redox-sensing transcriptional regulator